MHLLSCEHPKRIFNKYTQEYVHVPCGVCDTCKRRRASQWVSRLKLEQTYHKYTFFVTLTYDDNHLPLLKLSNDGLLSLVCSKDDICIPFKDLKFDTDADSTYFHERMALGGIPYASTSDLQKFHKRLNKYFHDKISSSFGNFRFFTVSEFGDTTLRPHFHSLYFVDDPAIADNFAFAVRTCWQNGNIYSEPVRSSANSYVAQYLNEFSQLPSFYRNSKIRPRHFSSKQPPIGMLPEYTKDFKEIFSECICERVVCDSKNPTEITTAPLFKSVENRIFPKIRAFDQISHSLRVTLYGLVGRGRWRLAWHLGFKEFLEYWKTRCKNNPAHYQLSQLDQYMSIIADGFCEKGINALKRLYYVSRRVINYCFEFGVSISDYVCQIEKYYDKKELVKLREFYKFQSSYCINHSFEECLHMYPEFAYLNQSCDNIELSDCEDHKKMCLDNMFAQRESTKNHRKNFYLDALKQKGSQLYSILKKFYYAKKCNEVIEAYPIAVT